MLGMKNGASKKRREHGDVRVWEKKEIKGGKRGRPRVEEQEEAATEVWYQPNLS